MKEILKEFKCIIKTVFTKDNLVKFMVYSFLALPLVLLFICFFLVPSNASATTTQSPEYEDGYQDGYNDGYQNGVNDSTNALIDSLRFFNAIELYYDSATIFMSTNGGATYQSVMSQGYETIFNQTSLKVSRTSQQTWNTSAYYYVDIAFTQPININTLRLPSSNRPDPVNVIVGDVQYSFTYSYVDGVPYLLTYNMLTPLTSHLQLYFRVPNGVTTGNVNYFYVYVDGFTIPDSYEEGFQNGVLSQQEIINNKNANINILKEQIQTLQTQLNSGLNSWQSLFYAMADTPFKTASNFLGFEIFGVNLFNALIGFITILAIFWVFKRLIK